MAATGDTFPTAGSVSGGGRVGHRLEVKFKFNFEFLNLGQECDWLSCCFTFFGNGLALSSFDFILVLALGCSDFLVSFGVVIFSFSCRFFSI